jgi:Glycosyltransferase family 87
VVYVSWVADRKGLTVPLCLLALIVAAAWLAVRDLRYALSLVQNADAEHLIGWDLLPTCHGLAALAAGKDPYIHSNLAHTPGPASWMAYYYPIAAAYPAKLICMAQDLLPGAYVGIYLLILVGSCAALAWSLRLSNLEVAIVASVSISAFSAYRWLALTGNIAVLEAPLAALSIAALHRRRYELSGAAFGLMSTLKVLPLVGVLAFLVIPVGWPQKARAIAAAVAAFIALHLVNAAISGSYTVSFVKATLGQIPNQPALFSEAGGLNNPNFIDFVFALLHTFNVDTGLVGPCLLLPDPGRGDNHAGTEDAGDG